MSPPHTNSAPPLACMPMWEFKRYCDVLANGKKTTLHTSCPFDAGALLPSRLWGAAAAAPSAAVSSVLDLSATHPELSRALTTIRANDPELAQYLGSPDTVCTFVAPTNQVRLQGLVACADSTSPAGHQQHWRTEVAGNDAGVCGQRCRSSREHMSCG